jgi:integrase/recombinase XerD
MSDDTPYLSKKGDEVTDLPEKTNLRVFGESPSLAEKPRAETLKNPAFQAEIEQDFWRVTPAHLQDLQFLETWVSGKSKHTERGYLRVARELLTELKPKTLRDATLQSLQLFLDLGACRKEGSKTQRAAVLKSLFTFGVKTGYLPANVAAFLPKIKMSFNLTERYLSEEEVMRMITLTGEVRDRTLIKTLYSGGIRVSELVGLNWESLQPRENGTGQITVLGKGKKRRIVILSEAVFHEVLTLKPKEARAFDPVFVSREQGSPRLSVRMIQIIIEKARLRAGILKKVSPHWLRHAHASHALDRGAPIHLVQATLGHASVATTGKYLHARPQESSSKYLSI